MAGHHKIPSHIIFFHILPRLPIDSLQRCRRVCTQWYSFLKTRLFVNMHSRHVTNGSSTLQLRSKLLFLPSFDPDAGFRIMDCEAPDDGLIAHSCHPFPFKANIRSINIRTSLHGLVCLGGLFKKRGLLKKEYYYWDLVLWNPLTGEHKMLCKTNKIDYSKLIALGLYYRDDDYKLLSVSSDLCVHIYSLKSDSWRKVDDSTNYNYQTLFNLVLGSAPYRWTTISSSIWLNGNLYFLKGVSVLKFDTKMEKFTIIPNHPSLETLHIKRARINVQKGVIHLGVKYETGSGKAYIQLWRLIGCDHETWEKVYVGAPCKVDIDMDPLHWIGKKDWLMIGSRDRNDRFLYKYKVDHHSKYYANGKSARIFDMYAYAAEVLNYTETFMSIDRS